ncbi:hypothetical protein FQR65_LT11966 [Abscondita terminalis]|nr:hypothetical protein FQR65_LT11966 [Abscondita terminalis]
MVRRKWLELGIVTFALTLLNCAESKESCSHRCDAPYGHHQLNYKERTTYSYEFSSELNLNLPKARDLKGTTQVKTTVFVTPQNGCGYVLQLQNFRIIGATGKTYENFVGIEKPVTFQYLNGAVGPEICAEPDDPSQSLNVKRAIISHLQLDSKGPQTDVFGVCPTESVVKKDNEDSVVRKMRNLNNCDKRENLEQNFMAETLRDKKILKSVPILNSNFVSVHRVNGGIVKHANIFEQYVAVVSPMDNETNATVRSVLQYVGTVAEMKPNLRTMETKSIIFDGIPTLLHKSTTDVIIATLSKFGLDRIAVSNTTAQNFLSLVKIMRESSKYDLIAVYKLIEDAYFRKIFLDALFRCGTSDALTATIELKKGNELHRSEEELLYQGFAYIRYPTAEIIRVAANLLNDNHVPKQTYPSIGSLVGRYCDQRTCPDDVVGEITSKFVSKLASPSKTEAVYALKALSNAKHLPENVAHQVFALAQNPHEHVRLRSAAYDVLASVACISDIRNGLISVLQNTEEDSEIRIKSYLVLAKCPDQHIVGIIETLVNNEPSYQVGGFISSHAKSSKNILSTIDIQKTYPQDPRKYSFTREIPHNFAGFSGKTGAEVIYSQKSFLPRIAKVNVSANMFGSDIDLFELEMRQENVDRIFEHLMGPVGLYQKEVEQYRAQPPNIDLDVDVSVKLFGSDLLFASFSEKPIRFMNRMLEALSENVKSKINFELSKQNGMIFIDSQLSYPTSMGFPLRLSVEGISSMQMRLENDFNEVHSRYGLMPSIDLDIVAGIALDAVVVETGVKVISKVHVATGFLVNTQQGEIKLSLPVEQQEASISHDIYFNQREFGEPDSMKPIRFSMNEEEIECLKGFRDYTGLDLCVRFNAPPPNNNEYLGGSYKAALILNNTDFSHVSLSRRLISNKEEVTQISVKILGRRQNTKTGVIIDLAKSQGYMARVTAILPNQSASAEVRYANSVAEKSIFASVSFDKQRFFGKLGLGISRKPHKIIYSPLVYVAIPGKNGQQHYPVNTKGYVLFASKGHDFKVVLEICN